VCQLCEGFAHGHFEGLLDGERRVRALTERVEAELRQSVASAACSRGARGINSEAMMAMNPATAENAKAAV